MQWRKAFFSWMVRLVLRRNAISGQSAKDKQPDLFCRAKPGPDITYTPRKAGKSGPQQARVMQENFL
jgi:hypothetical protein